MLAARGLSFCSFLRSDLLARPFLGAGLRVILYGSRLREALSHHALPAHLSTRPVIMRPHIDWMKQSSMPPHPAFFQISSVGVQRTYHGPLLRARPPRRCARSCSRARIDAQQRRRRSATRYGLQQCVPSSPCRYPLSRLFARSLAWNAFHCDIDEDLILSTAQLLKKLGLQDAGYGHVNIDDCYAEKNRSSTGALVADKVRFKGGMRTLTNKLHALGLCVPAIGFCGNI
jgi:hypothetical protein